MLQMMLSQNEFTHKHYHHWYDKSRYVFDPAVTEGMLGIGLFLGKAEARQGYEGRTRIGEVVERVRDDRKRAAEYTCRRFSREE